MAVAGRGLKRNHVMAVVGGGLGRNQVASGQWLEEGWRKQMSGVCRYSCLDSVSSSTGEQRHRQAEPDGPVL